MKNKRKISKIFESIKERPLVYLGKLDFHRATCFIHGFYTGYEVEHDYKLNILPMRDKVLVARGWQVPSVYPEMEMKKKGYSDEEIISELLEIEIETWQMLEQENVE
jgi:hypothetical protein